MGLDPSQYGADKERLYSDVVRERPRMERMRSKYDIAPASHKYDPVKDEFVPDTYRFTPNSETRQKTAAAREDAATRQLYRQTVAKHGHVMGKQARAELDMLAASGDRAGVLAYKRDLDDDNAYDRAKNVYDRRQNALITSEMQSPVRGPGFVYRTLADSSPAQRSALYRVLGWGDAASAETQAQIAQDAYNTQMAIASQQQPGAAEDPDDKTIAGQTRRHMLMIDRMLASDPDNGPDNAIAAQTNFNVQGLGMQDPVAARTAAEADIADRMARVPAYRNHYRVTQRMAQMASKTEDEFVRWASTVNISASEARSLYSRLRNKPTTATAGSRDPLSL
jgi:hypothetical protein